MNAPPGIRSERLELFVEGLHGVFDIGVIPFKNRFAGQRGPRIAPVGQRRAVESFYDLLLNLLSRSRRCGVFQQRQILQAIALQLETDARERPGDAEIFPPDKPKSRGRLRNETRGRSRATRSAIARTVHAAESMTGAGST